MLDRATTGRFVTERFSGDMNHDLMAVAAVHGFPAMCHETLGNHAERIGSPGTSGQFNSWHSSWSVFIRLHRFCFHRGVQRIQHQRADFRWQACLQHQ